MAPEMKIELQDPSRSLWKELKEFVRGAIRSRGLRLTIIGLGLVGLVLIAIGFLPGLNSGQRLWFTGGGVLLVMSNLLLVLFCFSAASLPNSTMYILSAIAAAASAAVAGAWLYAYAPLPVDTQKLIQLNLISGGTIFLIEKFGRFLFFSYPIAFAASILVCAFLSVIMPSKQHSHSHWPIVVTVSIALLVAALTAAISAHVSEWGFAQELKNDVVQMGPIWVLHYFVTLILFIVLVGVLVVVEFQHRSRVRALRFGIGIAGCAGICAFVMYNSSLPPASTELLAFPPGTGLGVVAAIFAATISLIFAAFLCLIFFLTPLIPSTD